MKKIELGAIIPPEPESVIDQQPLEKKPTKRKWVVFGGIFGLFVLLVIILVFFLLFPALRLKKDALALMAEAQGIYQEIQANNLKQGIAKLNSTKKELNNFEKDYQKLVWVKFLPLAGGYYKDGTRVFASGRYLLEAADIAVETLVPYADLLGLEGREGTKPLEAKTMEERLMLVLDTLDKIQPSMDKIGEKLEKAQQEIKQINTSRYPETLFGKKVKEKVVSLVEIIDGTAKAAVEIKPIVGYLKPLLGFPNEKKYLLLFQNDAELRPTGGFLTAYAILSVHKGNFKPLGSYDIYTLDERFGNRLKPPEPILNYHKNVFYWHLRDMNLSPDFKTSMDTFWENYRKTGSAEVDGIIAVDTKLLVDIFQVLGKIGVPEWGNFSAEIDKRCNCPQVFYALELLADKPVGTLKTERKAVIGPLMHSMLLNIMQSPRKKWPEFFNIFFTNIQEKHLLFYFFDEEVQKAIEILNAGGRIKDYDADYLHINDCNFAGAKSNMYIRVNVSQEINVDANGEVTKLVTIDYRNPEKASDCNLERGELCLNGLYRDWLRIYVPEGSQLIEATGSEIEVKTYQELGKTVFEAFYGDKAPLRPQGKAQLTFKYKLPFKIDKDKGYKLLIQKQPGTYGYEYQVKLGSRQETFDLRTDRELRW